MKLARVTGTVTATAKDARLVGLTLLSCELADGTGAVIAVDTVGAGHGDEVVIAFGSAARMPAATSGAPVDAAVTAIVDPAGTG